MENGQSCRIGNWFYCFGVDIQPVPVDNQLSGYSYAGMFAMKIYLLLPLLLLSSVAPAGDISKKVTAWQTSDWIAFMDRVTTKYVVEEAMGDAFNSVGGYFPLADILWELSNSGTSVRSDLQHHIRQRLNIRGLDNYKKWRYEKFLDCLTWSPCEEVRELENSYLGKNAGSKNVSHSDGDTETEQPEKIANPSEENRFKTSNWKISQWIKFIDKAASDSFEAAYASVGGRFPLADSLWRLSNSGSPVSRHLQTLVKQRLATKGLENYKKWTYQPILDCLSWSSCEEVTEAEDNQSRRLRRK